MARTYVKQRPTKELIMQVGLQLFLKDGFKATTCSRVAKELKISPGNMTFHYPTKEHLLTELVQELGDFQWMVIKEAHQEGESFLLALCMELATMAAYCEQSETVRDLMLAAYTNPMPLAMIRKNDVTRAPMIFGEFCPQYTEADYARIQNLVSGIEYAMLSSESTEDNPLDKRIASALDCIMMLYQVPESLRKQKVEKVLARDYMQEGAELLESFKVYVNDVNARAVKEAQRHKSHVGK